MDESEIEYSMGGSTNYDDDSNHNQWGEDHLEIPINWRGWKNVEHKQQDFLSSSSNKERSCQTILPLVEWAAKTVAHHKPFEIVENLNPPVDEHLRLRITYWSFPDSEDEIRLYACLANGNSNEYDRADMIIRNSGVKNLLQIGLYISATVRDTMNLSHEVSLTFDRRRIVSCTCTCSSSSIMCCHIVAVCLVRIYNSRQTELRAPVSENLLKLHKDQLIKFAQHLITKLPQQILPTAQHILDELLSNLQPGAPNPTSGPIAFEKTNWCLDLLPVLEGIRKTLVKLKTVSPEVVSPEMENLGSQNQYPQLSVEFSAFLRPLRGREPEGMWNLISIIKHLMKKGDENSVVLLKTLTEETVDCDYVICWWFTTKTRLRNNTNYNNNFLIITQNINSGNNKNHIQNFVAQSIQGSSYMCDEIVRLWRLTVLNPKLTAKEKEEFYELIEGWHIKTMRTIFEKYREDDSILYDLDKHPGFKAALKACLMDWDDYPIAGLTNNEINLANDSLKPLDLVNNHTNCLLNNNHLNKSSTSKISNKLRSYLKNKMERDENRLYDIANLKVNDDDDQAPSTSSKKNGNEQAEASNSSQDDGEEKSKDAKHTNGKSPNHHYQKTIDDELNFLYRYEISINNDLNCKYPHVNQQQQFTYTLSTKKDEDPIEILFARAETLYAHGQDKYAIDLVIYLANYILNKPPKIEIESNQANQNSHNGTNFNSTSSNNNSLNNSSFSNSTANKNKLATNAASTSNTGNKDSKIKKHKIKGNLINASMIASEMYSKLNFLCDVLISKNIRLDLAFRIGLLGLELARTPAVIKALEVKLFHQEQELITSLRKIPLGKAEMDILREKGRQISDGKFTSRGSLLPLTLASFIFEILVLSKSEFGRLDSRSDLIVNHRLPVDEYIGFECAVAAIGFKCPFSEKDHLFLWESIRRLRFEFILNIITHYKDKENLLVQIMEKMFDKENNPHNCSQNRANKYRQNQHQKNMTNGSTFLTRPFSEEQHYCDKYSKCNCSLKDLNSKLITSSSPNYTHTYNIPHHPNKNKYKDKAKQNQNNDKSIGQMNVQFMIDLGKALLSKAGCNISESFDNNNLNAALAKPHRKLHYCGFLFLLYALGLNNQLIKWLQRTYSTLVSYMIKEAIDIGASAISCLEASWKGYLTPSEAMQICTQTMAINTNDKELTESKARLALSVLSESQALRLIDIRLAIKLCKDQNEGMLIAALESIGNSHSNGGGLSSDILFETAQNWYALYNEKKDNKMTNNCKFNSVNSVKNKMMQQQVQMQNQCIPPPPIYPAFANADYNNLNGQHRLHPQLIMHPQINPHLIPPPPFNLSPLYYPQTGYFSGPPNHPNILTAPPPPPPNYAANLTYQLTYDLNVMIQAAHQQQKNFAKNHFQFNLQQAQLIAAAAANQQHSQPAIHHAQMNNNRTNNKHQNGRNQNSSNKLPLLSHPFQNSPLYSPYQAVRSIQDQEMKKSKGSLYRYIDCTQFLWNAYHLGSMALYAMPNNKANNRSDDRTADEFDLQPQYYDEIVWLGEIIFKFMGPDEHYQFLTHLNKISSPFILYEIIRIYEECLPMITLKHPNLLHQPLNINQPMNTNKSTIDCLSQPFKTVIKNLLKYTQSLFDQCLRYIPDHLTNDHDELISIIMKAKYIFMRTNQKTEFKNKLDSIKNACKDKVLLEKIDQLVVINS